MGLRTFSLLSFVFCLLSFVFSLSSSVFRPFCKSIKQIDFPSKAEVGLYLAQAVHVGV